MELQRGCVEWETKSEGRPLPADWEGGTKLDSVLRKYGNSTGCWRTEVTVSILSSRTGIPDCREQSSGDSVSCGLEDA